MAGSYREQVLTAQSALDTTATPIDATQYSSFGIMVEFGAGTSAGVVSIEAAPTVAYAGTWFSLGTAVWSAASKVESSVNALRQVGAIRARISTAIVGGTVNVWLLARE